MLIRGNCFDEGAVESLLAAIRTRKETVEGCALPLGVERYLFLHLLLRGRDHGRTEDTLEM